MPEKKDKTQIGLRLSDGAQRRLNHLADQLQVDRSDVVDLALKHLYGTAKRGEQPYLFDPPPADETPTRKGPNNAA